MVGRFTIAAIAANDKGASVVASRRGKEYSMRQPTRRIDYVATPGGYHGFDQAADRWKVAATEDVRDFVEAAEKLLSPVLRISPLTANECDVIAEYLMSMTNA